MRIENLTLHRVGPFEHAEIGFRRGLDPALADVTLLVGENGTGKSTILYSLAAAIGEGGLNFLGDEKLSQRLWGRGSWAELRGETETVRAEWRAADSLMFRVSGDEALDLGRRTFTSLDAQEFTWAAFAYAGMRTVGNVRVTAMHEVKESPLENALSFTETANSQRFAQWLANLNYFRLQARENDPDAFKRFQGTIDRIERAISDVLGEELRFVFRVGEVDVRVRSRSKEIEFNVLPDGLKSVLSWLADVLMRLDRIPWVDRLPIEERSFLLLLDEIDVHLHPAWQRRVLPFVQRLFPKAQIIATTHSPLVVASAADSHVVVLRRGDDGQPEVRDLGAQIGSSYSAVLRAVFGVESEFDQETEERLQRLNDLKRALIANPSADRIEFDRLAEQLGARSEELAQIVSYERRQLERQLQQKR